MPIVDYSEGMPPGFPEWYENLCARLDALERESGFSPQMNANAIRWTASQAWLIELVYSLKEADVINNGDATLSQIALALQQAFNVALGNFYRGEQENRLRKNPTPCLDHLKIKYLAYINRIDDNPHPSTK